MWNTVYVKSSGMNRKFRVYIDEETDMISPTREHERLPIYLPTPAHKTLDSTRTMPRNPLIPPNPSPTKQAPRTASPLPHNIPQPLHPARPSEPPAPAVQLARRSAPRKASLIPSSRIQWRRTGHYTPRLRDADGVPRRYIRCAIHRGRLREVGALCG